MDSDEEDPNQEFEGGRGGEALDIGEDLDSDEEPYGEEDEEDDDPPQ